MRVRGRGAGPNPDPGPAPVLRRADRNPASRLAVSKPWPTSAPPPAGPAAGARGGASNAYRRWFEDQVRELPSGTAASATSG